MTHKYRLSINGKRICKANIFLYNYGNSKNITIYLCKQKAIIEFNTKKVYDLNDSNSYLYKLLREGLKRICLIHYIKYEMPLVISGIVLSSDSDLIDVKDRFNIYSLLNKKPIRCIDDSLKKDEIIQKFIETYKTKFDKKNQRYIHTYTVKQKNMK